jgi:peptide/nickel transport system substrate-binding protein
VTFSDGTPFTSADVVFTFQAIFDPKVKSEIASSLMIDGKPIQVRALDAATVVIVLPAPYGPGLSMLDSIPILPRHKLAAALEAGTFREAWSTTTPVSEIVGLGPFVIQEYVSGQKLVFARNPKFWEKVDGRMLPYLDSVELQFVPDQNAEVLRLQAGQIDAISTSVRFEDLAALQDLEKAGKVALHVAGDSIAPDMLWFNLNPARRPRRGARGCSATNSATRFRRRSIAKPSSMPYFSAKLRRSAGRSRPSQGLVSVRPQAAGV